MGFSGADRRRPQRAPQVLPLNLVILIPMRSFLRYSLTFRTRCVLVAFDAIDGHEPKAEVADSHQEPAQGCLIERTGKDDFATAN